MRFLSSLIASVLGTFIAFGVIFLFMILMFAAMVASSDQTPRVRTGSVLVVNLDNAVPELTSADPFSALSGGTASFDLLDFRGALEKAAVDDRVDAVWIKLRTYQPGGSWGMLYELHSALETFKETSGKPVYASSDDYGMDEASYFIASVADSVFISPGSIFEYNGFYLAGTFFARTLDMLDIEAEVVRTGEYKSAGDQFTSVGFSPENEEQLRAYLDTMNDVFMSSVGRHRGLEEEELRRIASNDPILTAEDAHAAGLVDQLAYPDEVESLIKARLGLDADDDLRTITLQRYARIPASEVGLGRGRDGDIAIVYARGAIVSGRSDQSPFGGSSNLGSDTFNDAIREAREDDGVKAVVLRIDSPGGSAAASEAMRREIELTAAEKPVIVSMGSLAASGGYYVLAQADHVVADPYTITGSIGVVVDTIEDPWFVQVLLGIEEELAGRDSSLILASLELLGRAWAGGMALLGFLGVMVVKGNVGVFEDCERAVKAVEAELEEYAEEAFAAGDPTEVELISTSDASAPAGGKSRRSRMARTIGVSSSAAPSLANTAAIAAPRSTISGNSLRPSPLPQRATCRAAQEKKPASSRMSEMMMSATKVNVASQTMPHTVPTSLQPTTPVARAMAAPASADQPIPSPRGCQMTNTRVTTKIARASMERTGRCWEVPGSGVLARHSRERGDPVTATC